MIFFMAVARMLHVLHMGAGVTFWSRWMRGVPRLAVAGISTATVDFSFMCVLKRACFSKATENFQCVLSSYDIVLDEYMSPCPRGLCRVSFWFHEKDRAVPDSKNLNETCNEKRRPPQAQAHIC
jgi:hypothetical protein